MKRLYNKFIDMLFYSKLFRMARIYHYKMAYEQGRFDYRADQFHQYIMEDQDEN
ncbi:hypothetical protein D3C75_1328040 [compost metagenome]